MPRILAPIAILLIALLVVAWLWFHAPPAPSDSLQTPTPVATATVVAADQSKSVAQQYRLAGTAVGDPISYAAIEMPDGSSSLYREGAVIGGLGRLKEIHADHAVITGEDGPIVLQLKPAPSPTSDPRRLGRAPRRDPVTPEVESEPEDDLDDTTDESEPEDDLDQPAS